MTGQEEEEDQEEDKEEEKMIMNHTDTLTLTLTHTRDSRELHGDLAEVLVVFQKDELFNSRMMKRCPSLAHDDIHLAENPLRGG